jgi:hypothetical protein
VEALQAMPSGLPALYLVDLAGLPALDRHFGDHSMVRMEISFLEPLYLLDFPALYLVDLVAYCFRGQVVLAATRSFYCGCSIWIQLAAAAAAAYRCRWMLLAAAASFPKDRLPSTQY